MHALVEAARFLQVPDKDKPLSSPLEYLELLEKGLPFSSIDRVAGAFAPQDSQFRYRIVPKATPARIKERRRLSKAQSELVTRLAEVWTDALRVWKSGDGARDFLHRKHPLIEDKRPVDIALQSEIGAQLVRDILGCREHGTAV